MAQTKSVHLLNKVRRIRLLYDRLRHILRNVQLMLPIRNNRLALLCKLRKYRHPKYLRLADKRNLGKLLVLLLLTFCVPLLLSEVIVWLIRVNGNLAEKFSYVQSPLAPPPRTPFHHETKCTGLQPAIKKVLKKSIGGGRVSRTTHFVNKPVMVLFHIKDIASASLHPTRDEFENSPALWVKTDTAHFTLVKRWHLVHAGSVVVVPSLQCVTLWRGTSERHSYCAVVCHGLQSQFMQDAPPSKPQKSCDLKFASNSSFVPLKGTGQFMPPTIVFSIFPLSLGVTSS